MTLSIKEYKAIAKRAQLESLDPQMGSVMDLFEHYSPTLHSIHDREACSFCQGLSLVHDPNEPSDVAAVRQVLALAYDLENGILTEKETGLKFEITPGSILHKLAFLLIQHRIYIPTRTLALSGAGDVSRAIQKINKRFAKKFGVEQKLIVGKIGKGYRMNPEIRLVSEANNP